MYVKTEKYEKALQVYNEILVYYPENLKAIVGKDLILQKIKKSRDAENLIKKLTVCNM